MKKILFILIGLTLWVHPILAETLSAWNGTTIGTSTGNLNAWNGSTLGTAAGNVSAINGTVVVPGIDLSGYSSLKGWWGLNNTLNDDSSAGNNLANIGGVTFSNSDKKAGTYSGVFSGAGTAYARLIDTSLATGTPGKNGYACTAYTIGGWCKIHVPATLQVIIAKGAFGGAVPFDIFCYQSKFGNRQTLSDGTTSATITGGTTVSADKWYFVAMQWDSSYLYLFVGDETHLVAQDATPLACASINTAYADYLSMGAFSGGNSLMTGSLDDMGLFNAKLTLAELQSWQIHGLNNSH
jgi:hypothetical protein